MKTGKPSNEKDRGLYVVWLTIEKPIDVKVGALGQIALAPGRYAYIGSAQRNRWARINRHLKTKKRKHWHFDYLRPYVTIDEVTLHDGDKEEECQLVTHLEKTVNARRAHPRFGSSDCRCGGHLLFIP